MSATTWGYEYAGKVTATLRHSKPGVDAPPMVLVESELLGYLVLTLEQAGQLATDLRLATEVGGRA